MPEPWVGRGQEPARVDLRALQSEIAQDPDRLCDGLVVQAGRVRTKLHGMLPFDDGQVFALMLRGSGRIGA
jgi:hypothetical protein